MGLGCGVGVGISLNRFLLISVIFSFYSGGGFATDDGGFLFLGVCMMRRLAVV